MCRTELCGSGRAQGSYQGCFQCISAGWVHARGCECLQLCKAGMGGCGSSTDCSVTVWCMEVRQTWVKCSGCSL